MPVVFSGQAPLLVIVRLRSLNEPRHTLPKSPLGAIEAAILPDVEVPLTATSEIGLTGSLVVIVMLAVSGTLVTAVGVYRIGSSIEVPACTTIGNERTVGGANSGLLDATLVICRSQVPLLVTVSARSLNELR